MLKCFVDIWGTHALNTISELSILTVVFVGDENST